jgi:3-oxoacyl-[acyl-carrier protein] reductase
LRKLKRAEQTDLVRKHAGPDFEKYFARSTEEQKNRLMQLIPLGRFGKMEEYASLAVYLASDNYYLVGQIISPNGGAV